jgi:hypothetical protein
MDKVIYRTPTVVIPIDLRDTPPGFTQRMVAYGVDCEQFLIFMFENYEFWDQSQDVWLSRLGWFLNQHSVAPGQDIQGEASEWYEWNDTLALMERAVGFFKSQIDYYLRHMGYMSPRWPSLFLERVFPDSIVLTIVPHHPGVINEDAHLPQSHRA